MLAQIKERNRAKDDAVSAEDFHLAEQLKNQIILLESQWEIMHEQSNTIILRNCVTQWQLGFASAISSAWRSGTLLKDFGYSCLDSRFHQDLLAILKSLAPKYHDALIRAFIILIPYDLPDDSRPTFGWHNHFCKKVKDYPAKAEHVEIVEEAAFLLITNAVKVILEQDSSERIDRITEEQLLCHIKNYYKLAATQKDLGNVTAKCFSRIFITTSLIAGRILNSWYFLNNIREKRASMYTLITTGLEPTSKANHHEMVLLLCAMRYTFTQISTEASFEVLSTFKRDLLVILEKSKKTSVRIAVLQTLERIVMSQPLNAAEANAPVSHFWQDVCANLK